jgi:excisionase family DNA binding protein
MLLQQLGGHMVTDKPQKDYMTEAEVAGFLGVPQRTLQTWRIQKRELPFVKIGRLIRYSRADITVYLSQRKVAVGSPA